MWIGLAIWVAKKLIEYFLKTNLDLSRQLEDAVKRTEEHQAKLKNLEDELESLIQDEKEAEEDIETVDAIIKKLDEELEQKRIKYLEAKKQNEAAIDNLSDDDAINADITNTDIISSGDSGFFRNPA